MLKPVTHPIIKFSVEHPWVIIGIALIITIGLVLPLKYLQIESDVESLLPEVVTQGADLQKTDALDKLLIMISGKNLFTVEVLQDFQKSYNDLQLSLPVKETIDPFSFITLQKVGSRLTAVPLSPGALAPVNEKDMAGFKLSMVSIISPPLVLTLDSSYSIHVMSAYYSFARQSSKPKKLIIISSVTDISETVLLASFTTLLGLMSLLLATINQTREFAIITSLGILFTAILSITLLPALLVLQPLPE